jgi:hypothetical protein
MSRAMTPFAQIDGKVYLVVNYSLDSNEPGPPLPRLLKALLRRHDASTILVLRRLTPEEAAEVSSTLDDAAVDAWARIVGAEET